MHVGAAHGLGKEAGPRVVGAARQLGRECIPGAPTLHGGMGGGRWRGAAGGVKKFPSGSDSRRGLGMEGKSGAEALWWLEH